MKRGLALEFRRQFHSQFTESVDQVNKGCFIHHQWHSLSTTFPVYNPATGQEMARVSNCQPHQTVMAIESSQQGFQTWKKYTGRERAHLLRTWYDLLVQHQDRLARILTAESGKPFAEAKGEIKYGASFLQWFAEEAPRLQGDVLSAPIRGRRILTLKQPLGVCGLVTPWNFPNAMITRKAGAALAAGCTVVIKPAPETPLSALALAELSLEAGIPPGVVNVIPCDAINTPAVGLALTQHSLVKKISFTGSTSIGKLLMQQGASTLKKMSLELGGNAPFIVFEDANVDAAVKGCLASKFRNAGQTCISTNRIYVHSHVYSEFTTKLKQRMAALVVGRGDNLDKPPHVGPLISSKAVDKVDSLVQDAVAKGAQVLLGGHKLDSLGPHFYAPTLLTHLTPSMKMSQTEIFGPVLPLYPFDSEEQVIQLANDASTGLAGYVYSNDVDRIFRVAEALELGMIGLNEGGAISSEVGPFGGIKESGFGREGSKYGLDEYTFIKYLCLSSV